MSTAPTIGEQEENVKSSGDNVDNSKQKARIVAQSITSKKSPNKVSAND